MFELFGGRDERIDTRQVGVGGNARRAGDVFYQRRNVAVNIRSPIAPRIVNRGHQLQERGLGVVGAAKEWLRIRGEKHRHRPAAAPGHGLHGIHVHAVDVGAFFAVDFYIDEQLVHYPCDLGIFKTFVRHHVTPVASRVTHRQQHRHIATLGFGKCRIAPRPPIHGVVAMLAQIWR